MLIILRGIAISSTYSQQPLHLAEYFVWNFPPEMLMEKVHGKTASTTTSIKTIVVSTCNIYPASSLLQSWSLQVPLQRKLGMKQV